MMLSNIPKAFNCFFYQVKKAQQRNKKTIYNVIQESLYTQLKGTAKNPHSNKTKKHDLLYFVEVHSFIVAVLIFGLSLFRYFIRYYLYGCILAAFAGVVLT